MFPAIAPLLMLAGAPAGGTQSIDAILRSADARAARDGCVPGRGPDDVVVCGRRDDGRDRLPLPVERDPQAVGAVANEAPRGDVQDAYAAGCGPFQGRRRCSKREAEAYGYGRGRDPITALLRTAAKLADGDAEVGPPATPPPRPR